MCGITGFLSAKPLETGARRQLDYMMAALHHRGPDEQHAHYDNERGCAFGHTRLSINDLECGKQPLYSVDRRYVLTVNGEFYNFKRYRSKLMALGERFTCRSDSEIAIGLYHHHGLEDFVRHLRGEFAVVLYDKEEDTLVLIRDRFGIRPLFFHFTPEHLVYGSEVKAVLRHPAVPKRFNSQALLNQMMHTMVPGSSAFEGVHALQPGHMMIVKRRNGRLEARTREYWDMEFPTLEAREERVEDPQADIDMIREKLIESVVLRLEADVPVGCYLSGGIDSCCILGLASGAQQSPVKAFTIAFDNAEYDESPIAKEMAESMNADQEVIHLKAEDLYGENYERTVWHAERTFYNTLGVAKYLMSKRVHECGYKSVVTGEGADELFGGYAAFKRDMFVHGINDETEEVRREYQAAMDKSNRLVKGAILAEGVHSHPAFDKLCGFTPNWIQPWLASLELARPLLHGDVLNELKGYDPVEGIVERLNPDRIDGRHPLDKAQYTWSKTMLEGQILNWGGDRVDMANSMESRPAFLDHHLAEAAVQVPPHHRIKGNTEKWVLREAVRGVLPERLYRREKFAFMAPPAHTDESKRAKVNALIDTHASPGRIDAVGIFDRKKLTAFLDGYKADRDPVSLVRKDAILNHILCLQILHHQYLA